MSILRAQAALDQLLPRIASAQVAYKRDHSRTWQSGQTHAETPDSDKDTAPDRTTTKPSDMTQDWSDLNIIVDDSPIRVRVDVYENRRAWGYAVRAETKIGLDVWMKIVNVGNELHRDRDWTIMEDED